MTRQVSVLAFDQDTVVVAGTFTPAYTVSTSSRFNGYFGQSSANNNDKVKYTRFFSKGGLYKLRLIYVTFNDMAKIDIGLDSSTNNLFSQVDAYTSGIVYNNVKEAAFEISRGYHDISFLANGKNASSSGYVLRIAALEFELIQEYPVYQDTNPANGGLSEGMVPLGQHVAQVAENTFTFNFADITDAKYSEIIIRVRGQTTASLALQMTLNGASSGYYQQGWTSISSTLANVSKVNQALIELLGTNIITGANFDFDTTARIRNNTGLTILQGDWVGSVANAGGTSGTFDATASFPLTQIVIETSTSTWKAGTIIEIFGVKKK